MREKHIVYFGQTPGQGPGSPINMLRHLLRLKNDGWKISIVAEWGQDYAECQKEGWAVHLLPHRKKWWPPFNPGNKMLRQVRMLLWAYECKKIFGKEKPGAILTYLSCYSELLAEVAANYSALTKIPMSVIIYDYAPFFAKLHSGQVNFLRNRYRWILSKARHNWFISEQLAEAYGFRASKETTLMPMPEGYERKVIWRDAFSKMPLIVYAGYIYAAQIPLLRELGRLIDKAGGRLLLLTGETPEVAGLCREEPISFKPYLPTNKEALDFVFANASAFLVAQCREIKDMPWLISSFPSKFVEFSHTGIPFLFVSPHDSAAYKWNEKQELPYNLAPEDLKAVRDFVNALKSDSSWERLAAPIRSLAETIFNPDIIQKRLEANLF